MIIVTDSPGQLGNQLWAYANTIALAKECKYKVVIAISKEYYSYLDIRRIKSMSNGNVIIVKQLSTLDKIIRSLFKFKKLFPNEVVNTYTNELVFKNEYNKRKIYFVNSWEQRQNKAFFIKNSYFIRSLISPNKLIKQTSEEKIKTLRTKNQLIVAVHIRRGDYKDFLAGKYYFDDSVYVRYMKQVLKIIPSNACFYIFSNEQIDLNNFKGVNVVYFPGQTPIGDMWSMSLCDYIIGPVSTFSMWASFWGNVPLYFMQDSFSDIDNFKPIIAQDTF